MARKNRAQLKDLFQNGAVPTAQHFGDLIDSALIKRDDHFMGYWREGTAYYLDDVVIWDKSLYVLIDNTQSTCGDGKPTQPKAQPVQVAAKAASKSAYGPAPDDTTKDPFCCKTTPDCDPLHWCQLQFKLTDDDWQIIDPGGYIQSHPDKAKKVGIGTDGQKPDPTGAATPPQAQFHVFEKLKGELKFNPDEKAGKGVELLLENWDNPDCKPESFASWRLDDQFLHQKTNAAQGFSFEHGQKTDDAAADPLMVVKPGPLVGIGTGDPKVALHISEDAMGDIELDPSVPSATLTNQQAGQGAACLTMKVDGEFADFLTSSKNGFRFKQKDPIVVKAASKYASKSPNSPNGGGSGAANGDNPGTVVIDEAGQVGIGTEQPGAKLDVTDQTSGAVQVVLDGVKPVLAILNLDDEPQKNTALSLGVDEALAVLATNAPCGFVFKQKKADDPNPKDIETGEKEVWIDQNGRVGIGHPSYAGTLDVGGAARQQESYMAILNDDIEQKGGIEDAVEMVCKFNPIQFSWKNTDTELNADGLHFGLKDSECTKILPGGLVKKNGGKAVMGVSYIELVPLLIQAIKEQQQQIEDLKDLIASGGGGKKGGYGA